MAQVTAQIVIAQAGNPAPGGYSSGSRDDIVVGSAVTATNLDDTSATWHRWTVSPYYPAGTLGGLGVTGDGTATCVLTPDVEGDIALTLEVAGLPLPGGGANYARQTVMLGIRAVLAGYAPGMPLPHPLEAGRGQSGAVDPSVGREGRIDEAIFALKQGLGVAGAGTPYASTPAAVGSAGKAGSSSDYARGDHVHAGVATIAQSGEAALTGAVTLSAGTNVTLTQAGQDISIAASGSSGGPAAAITWDTTQATDSAVGRYQTWAEVRTAANATDAPLTILLVGTPTTSGTTTDDWPHVTWYSNDGDLTLTFTEGVVVKHSRFDVAGLVTSTATTTTNLQYSDGTITELRGKFSAGTKGLIGTDGAGTATFRLADSSIVSTYAFHTAATQTVNVYAGACEFEAGAVDHFEGTAGTVNVYRTNETIGEVETDTYSGTSNRYVPSTPEKIQGVTVAAGTPSAGKALVATSGTAAEWAAQTVGGRAVSTTAPNDGDALVYSGENFQWEPLALTDASSLNGVTVSGTPVDGMVLRATSGSAAAWRTPDLLWSPVAFVEASSGSASTAVDICCGQEFEVYRNYYCDGIRFRWATNSGTPTCTVELWDDTGTVLKTATQVVSATGTTYEVTFGTPQDLTSYKAKKLVVSVWQQTGGRYYSMVTTSYVSDAAPMLIGRDVWSRGSIYGAGHVFPDTNTTAEVYGVEPILRLK